MQELHCLDMVQRLGNMSIVLRLGCWHTFNRAPSTVHHDPPFIHSACTKCISRTQEDLMLMLRNVQEGKMVFLAAHIYPISRQHSRTLVTSGVQTSSNGHAWLPQVWHGAIAEPLAADRFVSTQAQCQKRQL